MKIAGIWDSLITYKMHWLKLKYLRFHRPGLTPLQVIQTQRSITLKSVNDVIYFSNYVTITSEKKSNFVQ